MSVLFFYFKAKEKILPSEKAFAYKMHLEAMNSSPVMYMEKKKIFIIPKVCTNIVQ